MNSEIRAKALARLAPLYEIDLTSSFYGVQRVSEYLDDPDSISPYVDILHHPGDIGPGGEELMPSYFELVAGYDDPWEVVERAEAFYDHDFLPATVAVVDLDGWQILRRSGRSWAWFDLPV